MEKINVTKVVFRLPSSDNQSNLLAYAKVTFDEKYEVDGFKVLNGTKGLFISFPQRAGKPQIVKGMAMVDGKKVQVEMEAPARWYPTFRVPESDFQNVQGQIANLYERDKANLSKTSEASAE